MAFIPVPNTASVEMIFTEDGQRIENRYHVRQASTYDVVSLAILGAFFVDWWTDNLKSGCTNSVQLVMVVLRALDSETSPSIEYTTGLPLSGSAISSAALPNHVTVAVRWGTGLRGRSYRGRTYHIGLTEADVAGNTLDATTTSQLITAYAALRDGISSLDAELVVVSRQHNNVPLTTGVATEIVSVSIDRTVDSQRRRLPGRGR